MGGGDTLSFLHEDPPKLPQPQLRRARTAPHSRADLSYPRDGGLVTSRSATRPGLYQQPVLNCRGQLAIECRGGGPGVGSLGELPLATGAGDPGTLSTFCAAAAPRPFELFAWLGRGRRCSRRMESPPARPR
jgi:hypothetical protein